MSKVNVLATTVQKTNDLFNDIEEEMGWSGNRKYSYVALKAVLHAIRDRLPLHEAISFGAQLTPLVRGLYYEGWHPSEIPLKMDKESFLFHIEKEINFPLEISIDDLVRKITNCLRQHMGEGEIDKIKKILPKSFGDLFHEQV